MNVRELNSDEARCAYPDRVWGTCGIPKFMHEETFAWTKGRRFFHEYVAPAAPPDDTKEK